jgi:hypothetical protein
MRPMKEIRHGRALRIEDSSQEREKPADLYWHIQPMEIGLWFLEWAPVASDGLSAIMGASRE